jgi:hypothetical protein
MLGYLIWAGGYLLAVVCLLKASARRPLGAPAFDPFDVLPSFSWGGVVAVAFAILGAFGGPERLMDAYDKALEVEAKVAKHVLDPSLYRLGRPRFERLPAWWLGLPWLGTHPADLDQSQVPREGDLVQPIRSHAAVPGLESAENPRIDASGLGGLLGLAPRLRMISWSWSEIVERGRGVWSILRAPGCVGAVEDRNNGGVSPRAGPGLGRDTAARQLAGDLAAGAAGGPPVAHEKDHGLRGGIQGERRGFKSTEERSRI